MSWKRRIAESSIFFDLMRENAFSVEVDEVDASVYVFSLKTGTTNAGLELDFLSAQERKSC